jgi:hypothetical protein
MVQDITELDYSAHSAFVANGVDHGAIPARILKEAE